MTNVYSIVVPNEVGPGYSVVAYYSQFSNELRSSSLATLVSFEEAVKVAEQAVYGYRVVSHHWELPVV
jgi:hypothetical protein